ncbi:hypothetical protein [Azospirillum palustre]
MGRPVFRAGRAPGRASCFEYGMPNTVRQSNNFDGQFWRRPQFSGRHHTMVQRNGPRPVAS